MARILVLDDEALIAMMLADWLEELGHETIGPAYSVPEALQLIEQQLPDAAILDVNVANVRSDAVAEVLFAKNIPIAFATGSQTDAISDKFAGALSMMKPFDFEIASNIINRLCAKTS